MEAQLENTGQPVNTFVGWQEKYLQPVVIALMILAMFSGFIVMMRIVVPDGPWHFLPWIILLVSAESILTTRWLATTKIAVNRLAYRAAEIVVILHFLRLFIWLLITGLPVGNEVEGYLFEPSTFLDPIFIVFSILIFFVWQQTSAMIGTFFELQLEPEEINYYGKESYERHKLPRPEFKNRRELLENYFKQWLIGGLILGVVASMTTFDLSNLGESAQALRTIGRLGLRPIMLIALLFYFITGLWLAGQGHLATMRSRWLLQDIESDPKMNRTWHRSSIALIFIIATIAAFLPIGSTFAISRILQIITLVTITIVNFVVTLLAVLLLLIVSIFIPPSGENTGQPLDLSGAVPDQFILPPPPAQNPSPLLGILFWIVISFAVGAATIFFLRGRGINITGSSFIRSLSHAWLRFKAWLASIWRGMGKPLKQLEQPTRHRLQTVESPAVSSLSWKRPPFRSLSPREKIRYYYLSVVRRAEEKGIERKPNETPSEYAADLKKELPQADGEVDAITNAFLKARYSPQPMTGDDIGPVKETWNRIKFAIRKRRT
jgi:hypothetical protein